LRILFVNWRDLSHPAAGGAEVFTEEVGKRLVLSGNEVTIFTAAFDGSEPQVCRSGMTIIRKGGKYGVYREARRFVRDNISGFDAIIDEINTVPFRIPSIVREKKVVALIHQLAREIWFYETSFPISVLGYFALEPLWLRSYRCVPTITVSNSTRNDLLKRGFQHVRCVYNGIGVQPLSEVPEKAPNPVVIFVGRLVKSKHPDHAISAFKRMRRVLPSAELWILGDGYMRQKLERRSEVGVKLLGRVSNIEKFELLKRAHVLLIPSVREGWGVSVIEANAMGTPAVGYRVPGLKDSVIHGETGFLVQSGDCVELARAAYHVLTDKDLATKLSKNALNWSSNFSWDGAARTFEHVLESYLKT